NVGTSDFIGLMARLLMKNFSGAILAIDYVGQRDTRWLTPLTVSGGYQGEEGDRQFSSACSYPTAASVFLFIGVFHYIVRFQRRDQSQNPGSASSIILRAELQYAVAPSMRPCGWPP